MSGSFVNRWLIHVIPDTIHVVGTLEDGWVEEILPVVASAVVEEVDPDGVAGATFTFEGLSCGGVSDEEIGDVVIIDVLSLLLKTLLVHEVILGGVDVRIGSDDEATSRVVDLLVHDHDVVLVEALLVELTVLIVLSILTVEPEDINWEAP